MKVAFQIDELEKINFANDSSVMLIIEAFTRGYEVSIYHPNSLSIYENNVFADMVILTDIQDPTTNKTPFVHSLPAKTLLQDMDIIFLRQDPPFDMAYITSTFLLEKVMDKVKVINNPVSVRNAPEKLLVTNFSHLMPSTLITRNEVEIHEFLNKHQQCVIKPLYGNAGADVFFLKKNDFNVGAIINYFLFTFKEQFIIQEFLPKVHLGDKRLILINGEYAGGINRVPQPNDIRSNMAVGGVATGFEKLSPKEEEICKTIGGTLKDLGLFFVGIDVIDGYLTEINVTSPTGLRAIQNFYNLNLATTMFDLLEEVF
ncbi:Glutathione synthetase [Candidatus Hepatincola sp. Av]